MTGPMEVLETSDGLAVRARRDPAAAGGTAGHGAAQAVHRRHARVQGEPARPVLALVQLLAVEGRRRRVAVGRHGGDLRHGRRVEVHRQRAAHGLLQRLAVRALLRRHVQHREVVRRALPAGRAAALDPLLRRLGPVGPVDAVRRDLLLGGLLQLGRRQVGVVVRGDEGDVAVPAALRARVHAVPRRPHHVGLAGVRRVLHHGRRAHHRALGAVEEQLAELRQALVVRGLHRPALTGAGVGSVTPLSPEMSLGTVFSGGFSALRIRSGSHRPWMTGLT